jgi:hypothetical protein
MSVVYYFAALAVIRYQMELGRSYATLIFCFLFELILPVQAIPRKTE